MGIRVKKTRKETSFILYEKVGISKAGELLALIKENLDRPITIDLTEIETIDTSVLQVLLALNEEARNGGATMRVVAPPRYLLDAIMGNGACGKVSIN